MVRILRVLAQHLPAQPQPATGTSVRGSMHDRRESYVENQCRMYPLAASACGLLGVVAVGGCATAGDSVAVRSYSPEDAPVSTVYSDDRKRTPLAAGMLDRRGRLHVTVFGSSSCPDIPTELHVEAPSRVRIHFAEQREDGDCTSDLAARTHVFDLPEQLTIDAPLQLVLEGSTVGSVVSGSEAALTLQVSPLIKKSYTY